MFITITVTSFKKTADIGVMYLRFIICMYSLSTVISDMYWNIKNEHKKGQLTISGEP